ncbi:MAG: hypothetical protein WC796_04435 [Candidatus Pacearchaeota archaeon]|jgi:putative transposon-encoded protein
MPQVIKKQFLRRTIRVGNSAGVLLPKSLLGSEVIVRVINPPLNVNRDVIKIMTPFLEDLVGIFLIEQTAKKAEILAVSTTLAKTFESGNYKIDIVPILLLRKSIKEKSLTREKIRKAKTILNKRLLNDLKKDAGI